MRFGPAAWRHALDLNDPAKKVYRPGPSIMNIAPDWLDENGKCKNCGKQHSYPHKNGCQFCEETRPHHHLWGAFGQKTELEECSPRKL